MHCNSLSWCGWHSAFPTKQNVRTAESTKHQPCSLTASQKIMPVIFCKHLEMMCHGCDMVQMSLHKYYWIVSCSRARSLAHSMHIPCENEILSCRMCDNLGMLVLAGPIFCLFVCFNSQFKMA